MIKDKAIAWNVKRKWIGAEAFSGRSVDRLSMLGGGAAVFQEAQADSELAGLAIGAAGDEAYHLWKLPWDLDRDQPIQARIHFAHATTDTDNPDWVIEMKGLAAGEALSDAGATPDETLTFAAKAVAAVANALEHTIWEESGASPFDDDDLFAQIMVECNGLGSAGANEITFLGIELAWTIKATGESEKRDLTNVSLPTIY